VDKGKEGTSYSPLGQRQAWNSLIQVSLSAGCLDRRVNIIMKVIFNMTLERVAGKRAPHGGVTIK